MEFTVVKPKRKYESVIIFHPDATENDHKQFFKKQKEILKTFDGVLNHVDSWGKRRLANPIEKLKVGTYFHTTFEANPESVAELERVMRISDQVLRFTHTKLDERISLNKHIERYREILQESAEKENEREKAFQARRQATAAGGGEGGYSRSGSGSRDGGSRDGGFRDGGPRDGAPAPYNKRKQ
jgi:small subunit ribosomal protein S6